jgi:glycosyltransferase involved in cell wall biosynthesis
VTRQVQKRAVIWNAHWRELGGGEKYAAELAALLLSADYFVTLLGISPDPRREIKIRFGIDLDTTEYRQIGGETDAPRLVKSEDLFINASFGSKLRAPHPRSILICHFPTKGIYRFLKFVFPRPGVISVHSPTGHPILTRKSTVTTQSPLHLIGRGRLQVATRDGQMGELEVDSSHLQRVVLPATAFPRKGKNGRNQLDPKPLLNVSGTSASNVTSIIRSLNPYATYGQIWANSHYSAHYFQKYWGLKPDVVYPPVSRPQSKSVNRDPRKIISIGRFFPPQGGHSKNHRLLLKPFRQLQKMDSQWQFVMLGGASARWEKYLAQLARSASKIPNAKLIVDADRTTAEKEMWSSTFFWSGTGLRSRWRPERAEHFGMAIVEAMSAGLIPLCFDKGGPKEILEGFPELRYRNLRELRVKTHLADTLPRDVVNRLQEVSTRYDRETFHSRASTLIAQLCDGRRRAKFES